MVIDKSAEMIADNPIFYNLSRILGHSFHPGHLILPTWRVGMLPKLRVGKWPTLFIRGLEIRRHFFFEVTNTIFCQPNL